MVVYRLGIVISSKYAQMLWACQSRFTEPKGARLVKANIEVRPELKGDLLSPAAKSGYHLEERACWRSSVASPGSTYRSCWLLEF